VEALTTVLFERMGLLLLFAFMISRIPFFKELLEPDIKGSRMLRHSVVFAIFGVACVQAGVVVTGKNITEHLWVTSVPNEGIFIGPSLVAIVMAGLFGGPRVGCIAGFLVGGYVFYLGGQGQLANTIVLPLAGIITGFTARFFSKDRIIAPEKALFIGMFMPILHMCLLLAFTHQPEQTIPLINFIGIPLVLTDSIAIAVFTAMIHSVIREKEQEAAMEASRALKIADLALPFLKGEFDRHAAEALAKLLYRELNVAAVSITDQNKVLAHVGASSDHHLPGQPIQTELSRKAIATALLQVAYDREDIQCQKRHCPLTAAIIVPLKQSGQVKGLIKIYFKKAQQIRKVELALAEGLGKILSNQLDLLAMEKMKGLIQEAELRNLQAQINPHFLFNTLHSIDSLIRTNPEKARYLLVQLSTFMRFNFKLATMPLIPLKKEVQHVQAYLEIVKVRFSDQLHIAFHVPGNIDDVRIPPFTIQPLVENSLLHGLKDVEKGGEIIVKITDLKDRLKIEVRDNGCGLPWGLLHRLGRETLRVEKGNGTGIYNVNQRLTGLLGPEARLVFQNLKTGGCCIYFYVPKTVEEKGIINENQSVSR